MSKRPTLKVLLAAAVLVVGCSSASQGGPGASSEVAFHGDVPVLPGFAYDTGLQPASGPAQMSLKLSAGGSIAVDTMGEPAGSKLQGKAAGGKLALDMHVKLEGHLKVDAGTVKYDGDLPGLENVDIPIGGNTPFDGFLLTGDPAKVVANVPETKLPDIPLGSVPGHLSLTVANGSTITTGYHGTCLDVHGGQATLKGTTTTSGKLLLKAAIVLEIPLVGKTINLPDITVDVPETNASLDSAAVPAPGVADGTDGTCGAPPPDPGTADGGTPVDGAANDAGGDASAAAGLCGTSLSTGSAKCNGCMGTSCCTPISACANDADCSALVACYRTCAVVLDQACWDGCDSQHPAGAQVYAGITTCQNGSCSASCQ